MEVFQEGQLEALYHEKCGPPQESSFAFVSRMFSKLLRYAHEFDRYQYTIEDLKYTDSCHGVSPSINCFHVHTKGVSLAAVRWVFPRASPAKILIVYVHTNTRSLCDATEIIPLAKELEADVFSFDLPGSGQSEGILTSQISHQLLDVIKFVTSETKITNVILWGRGTGTYPVMDLCASVLPKSSSFLSFHIRSIVLDSPFISIKQVVQDLIAKYESSGYYFPHYIFGAVSKMLRMSIRRRAGIDLYDIRPIELAPQITTPGFVMSAISDDYFDPSHGARICDSWGGDCSYATIQGSQFSKRAPSAVMLALDTIARSCACL